MGGFFFGGYGSEKSKPGGFVPVAISRENVPHQKKTDCRVGHLAGWRVTFQRWSKRGDGEEKMLKHALSPPSYI
jgi:hypothetical protein